MEFLSTLAKGGLVMVPLVLCSLAALTVIVERCFYLRRAGRSPRELLGEVESRLAAGDEEGALEACERTPGAAATVLAAGLRAQLGGNGAERAMEEQGMAVVPSLSRGLVVLDTVVTAAPLLGLLGTVLGMIRSFHVVAVSGTGHPIGITSGIAEALIATATGLVIAIFSLIGFNYFGDRVKQITAQMELGATRLSNLLDDKGRASAEKREAVGLAVR